MIDPDEKVIMTEEGTESSMDYVNEDPHKVKVKSVKKVKKSEELTPNEPEMNI